MLIEDSGIIIKGEAVKRVCTDDRLKVQSAAASATLSKDKFPLAPLSVGSHKRIICTIVDYILIRKKLHTFHLTYEQ